MNGKAEILLRVLHGKLLLSSVGANVVIAIGTSESTLTIALREKESDNDLDLADSLADILSQYEVIAVSEY